MRKLLALIITSQLIMSCAYHLRVADLSDNKLCRDHGVYTMRGHSEGMGLTRREIANRPDIDKERCQDVANAAIRERQGAHKKQLCENLSAFYYKGAYEHYKRTLDKIKDLGYADEQCITIAEFYQRRLSMKQEKWARVSEALSKASEDMNRSHQETYGRGSKYNPIYVELK